MTLKYPDDRANGYVLLTDGKGNLFIPEFTRIQDSALGYCRAFMDLGRRLDKTKKQEEEK